MKLSEKLAALGDDDQPKPAAKPRVRAAKRVATPPPAEAKAPGKRPAAASPKRAASTKADDWSAAKRKVRQLVLEEIAPKLRGLQGDALAAEVKSTLDQILRREDVKVSPLERRNFVQEVIQDTLGYGPLDPLLADPSVSEIMCNAHDDIWVERAGKLEHTGTAFTDDSQYRQVIDKIVSAVGRRVDESAPMVDARLPDGSRVNAIIPPVALHGSVLTIRKFAADPYTAQDLIGFGSLTIDLALVLEACVKAKLNILVSGGTGTGKTTVLNVLSSFIPDNERILTIEDAAELQLQQPHVINLEARPPNAEGSGEVRIRDLVRNALRMRPDRIIVGECRGAEALDMLQAMNTGHEGSLTTVHANSARDALSRLETMVLMAGFDLPVRAIREQVAAAIHVIMQLERLPDGRRVVTSLSELQGMEGDTFLLQDVFEYRFDPSSTFDTPSGHLVATGLRPRFAEQLERTGVELPAAVFRAPAAPAPASGAAARTARSARTTRAARATPAPRVRDLVARERRR